MSGNVPPPPPPPGPASQGYGDDSSREPVRRPSAAAAPPSFAPGTPPDARATGSPSPAPSPHAPIPPAPNRAEAAPTQVQQPQPASAPQQPQYTAPVRQPAYQPAVYQQPVYEQAHHQQPPQGPPQQYGYTPQQYAYQQPAPPPGTAQHPTTPAGKRRGKRLTPGWIAFIAADAILIVVAVVFAVNVLGGSDLAPVDAAAQPSAGTSQEAQDDAEGDDGQEAADDPGASVSTFASPSRNISCEVFENQVSCAIAELNQQPAPVEGCDGTTGYVVTLDGQGKVALPCVAGADKPKKAPKKLDEVPYGESVTEGDFTCSSEQDGMYCQHDPTGKGFSLARAGVGTY
ncbi:hypothetical protein BCE75_104259 [Isoptericola sp. CG 20/1183]|uniref:Uncharacterized protein n=1 Tax=Isoptericola halotolerans TaxID=300560 RepID=A0ABX5EEY9_9MICO|nr:MULTISPECIES: hypothetical protein [Isoptericola]PRZ07568.1 hypothetical protein BCL65_1045 [Isoptericola halotolerans]PRZ08072.1 hypothetical protein BCE75_104259 [Isoptericola sp. CG 20/1183]